MALFIAEDTDSTFVVRPGENTLQAAASALTAEGWADAAALSAATAEAAAGPTYASTAAGLAATTSGEAFAVDAGGGLVSVYLNSSGTAVLQRTLATTGALAASGGSALVGFLQSGTGATARTAQSKMRETFSVFDCMSEALQAKISSLTATTSDATAINAAIDAAIANAVARAPNQEVNIFFPDGDYYYNSITITSDRINLVGNARLLKCSTTGDGIYFNAGASRKFGGGVQGLILGAAVTQTTGALLRFDKFSQIEVKVTVKPFPLAGWDGLYFDQCTAVNLSGIEIEGCLEDGIHFNECMDIYLRGGRSDANARFGVIINNCAGVYASAITAWNNGGGNWSIKAVGAAPVFADTHGFMFFSDCVADLSGGHGWDIERLSNSVFTGCWASSQNNTTADRHGFRLDGCTELQFNGCIALNNNAAGMRLEGVGSVGITINGGRYNGNGKVAGSAKRIGISLGNSSDVTIVAARCTDIQAVKTQQYGVGADDTLLALHMFGVDMRGNATGPYQFITQPSSFSHARCITGETPSYATATSVATSPFIDDFTLTGTTDVYDITPKYTGRRITCAMASTARFVSSASGGAFRLPDPTITPGANGTASFYYNGTDWLCASFLINDNT